MSTTESPNPPSARKRGRVYSFLSSVAAWTSNAYVAALIVLLLLMMWWGERHWLLSLLLFAPPAIFALPFAALSPLCLIFRPRLVLTHIACVGFLAFGYMTFRWNSPPDADAGAKAFKVVSHNAGDGDARQFGKFLSAHRPEVVVLQDSKSAGPLMSRTYPRHYVSSQGEFLLVSEHPIRNAQLLDNPRWNRKAVAARFEIVRNGQRVAIYNVHLPTPRSQFNRFLSLRILGDLVGREDTAPGFANYRQWVAARIEMARELERAFAAEKLPYVVCGDFNTPDRGYIYSIFSNRLEDAHASAGRGWGLTFPGFSRHWLSLRNPWLRIDYAFAGKGWRPIYCETAPPGRAQHRPVAAYFEPVQP